MNRFVCIHGHFYQPPRENPWLEAIELQDSAYPYHDWNERITAEAYGPNARSRILDGEGRIVNIVNNYARMSFNVGPTLLKWMQDATPEVYQAVLEADRESKERFSGHGSAMAQAYNHMIMPLSNARDKYTQVYWGLRDFEYRFGRKPEGMWLPETAVDLESLDIMAGLGMKFTVLEPGQAHRVKRVNGRNWKDMTGGQIDPTRAYFVRLPSGRRMNLFFYDGPISRAVAFEGILSSGEAFADRLLTGFADGRTWPQVVNIATDGESYGHHHRFGDMALAYALQHIDSRDDIQLTNYAEFLERFPPDHEVEIYENTAWSCAHGVERWNSDCGCNTGARPEWNQSWRRPLREALDWLREDISPKYEEHARALFKDPWNARDEYIDVILHRDDHEDDFFGRHAARDLSPEERVRGLKLLELQRHALLMYTSCGWFFDEISGIEATQVIEYAGRVIQLAQELFGDHTQEGFLSRLEQAQSNIPENGNGRTIYERSVVPAIVDLHKVGAHFAVSSLFEEYGEHARVYCYNVDVEDYQRQAAGTAQLAFGRARMESVITHEVDTVSFGVLHFGDHNINAGVRSFRGDERYQEMKDEAFGAFSRADLPEAIRLLDRQFGELTYSLRSLFKDEQRRVLDSILRGSVEEAEGAYRGIFEHHAPLMRFLMDINFPQPSPFKAAAELILNANVRRLLSEAPVDAQRLAELLQEATVWKVPLDEGVLAFTLEQTLHRLARRLEQQPEDMENLRALASAAAAGKALPFTVNLAQAQNHYWQVLQTQYPSRRTLSNRGDDHAAEWLDHFRRLGVDLDVRIE